MKKEIRERFRNQCFRRDKHRCRMCGFTPPAWDDEKPPLDAHHITDRNLMPFGGYVGANGISLCPLCHELAELWHLTGVPHPGYSPADLYAKIGSSYDWAVQLSFGLDPDDETARSLKWWNRIVALQAIERRILTEVHETVPSAVTWELTCEEAGEAEPLMLLYGKGRY